MSTDDEIPAVSDVENAKKSDGTSTAGEHNVNVEPEEQPTEKSTLLEDEVKKDTNKRDIDELDTDEEKTDDSKEEEDLDDSTVPTTPNKKMKKNELLTDDTEETSPKVLNEELNVV